MAKGTCFSTGKVVKLLAPSEENENTQREAPVRQEIENQSYHRAKNVRRYLRKPVTRNWEIKQAWRTWEGEYLHQLGNSARKLLILHVS